MLGGWKEEVFKARKRLGIPAGMTVQEGWKKWLKIKKKKTEREPTVSELDAVIEEQRKHLPEWWDNARD